MIYQVISTCQAIIAFVFKNAYLFRKKIMNYEILKVFWSMTIEMSGEAKWLIQGHLANDLKSQN